jgi:hypothetical protein
VFLASAVEGHGRARPPAKDAFFCGPRSIPAPTLTTLTRYWRLVVRLLRSTCCIPHAELLKSVARRIVDRRVLHLIKMWLNAPWKKPTNEERRHARPRPGTTGVAFRKVHPSHCAADCWQGWLAKITTAIPIAMRIQPVISGPCLGRFSSQSNTCRCNLPLGKFRPTFSARERGT